MGEKAPPGAIGCVVAVRAPICLHTALQVAYRAKRDAEPGGAGGWSAAKKRAPVLAWPRSPGSGRGAFSHREGAGCRSHGRTRCGHWESACIICRWKASLTDAALSLALHPPATHGADGESGMLSKDT